MSSPFPTGATSRLEAVLLAGQMQRAANAAHTDAAPGDEANAIVRRAQAEAARSKASKPKPLKRGNTSPTPLKRGNTSPKPLKRGNTSPTPLKRGNTSPKPLKRSNTSPKPLKRDSTSPKPLKRGNTSPAKMQDAARAAVAAPGASKSRAMQRGNTSPSGKLKGAAQAALLSASVGKKEPTPAKPTSRDSSPARDKWQAAGKTVMSSNALSKNSPVVEDLVNKYKKGTAQRREELERMRQEAEECAERRRKAVTEYLIEQDAAADATIKQLQEQLASKGKLLDDMQNKSDDAVKELEDSGKITAVVEQLRSEKESLEQELAAKIKSCDEERDAAREAAAAKLAAAESEWEMKLAEATADDAEEKSNLAKERDECNDKLAKALADLAAEVKAHNALEKRLEDEEEKFHQAAKAASDAAKLASKAAKVANDAANEAAKVANEAAEVAVKELEGFQDNKDQRFEKKMRDFVTSVPASAKANDVQGAEMRA